GDNITITLCQRFNDLGIIQRPICQFDEPNDDWVFDVIGFIASVTPKRRRMASVLDDSKLWEHFNFLFPFQNEALEKDKILLSLLKAQVEGLKKNLAEMNEDFEVGAFSSEQKFIRDDLEGIEAFEEILSDRRDFCAFGGTRGVATIFEDVIMFYNNLSAQALCDHILFTVMFHKKAIISK
ncbi:hypothetical protein ACJX0J_018471, partial [Zea mays]